MPQRASSEGAAGAGLGSRARLRLLLGLKLLSVEQDRIDRSRPARSGFAPGRKVPSIRAVAAATGVHRNTAAAVYRDLAAFGLLRAVPGCGTFAAHPPDPASIVALRARCPFPELGPILRAELSPGFALKCSWPAKDECGDTGPRLLLPLDEAPPRGRRAIPLAPRGSVLRAMRGLRPDATVELISTSRRVARLVRRCLQAMHGARVGLVRSDEPASRTPDPDVQMRLVDAAWLLRHAGEPLPQGLVPLRLTPAARAAFSATATPWSAAGGEGPPVAPYHGARP